MHLISFRHFWMIVLLLIQFRSISLQAGGLLSESVQVERIAILETGFVRNEFGNLLNNGTFRETFHTDTPVSSFTASTMDQFRAVAGKVIVTESRFAQLKQNGVIPDWVRSPGTYPIGNNVYVEVCVAGYCDLSVAPNLTFASPNGVTIGFESGESIEGKTVYDDQVLYVDWSITNTSPVVASHPSTDLEMVPPDEYIAFGQWTLPSIPPNGVFSQERQRVGPFLASFGSPNSKEHTFLFVIDGYHLIPEALEDDNTLMKKVMIHRRNSPSFVQTEKDLWATYKNWWVIPIPATNEIDRIIIKTRGNQGVAYLYVGVGYTPSVGRIVGGIVIEPPKFDYSSTEWGTEQTITIPGGPAVTYYALLYAPNSLGYSDVTITLEGYYKPSRPPKIEPISKDSEGRFRLRIQGKAGVEHTIQVSEDLVRWRTLANVTPQEASFEIADNPTESLRFYRVVIE